MKGKNCGMKTAMAPRPPRVPSKPKGKGGTKKA